MTAADQIAEINAQFAERVKVLERERDAEIAMVRERCKHVPVKRYNAMAGEFIIEGDECKYCGASMP